MYENPIACGEGAFEWIYSESSSVSDIIPSPDKIQQLSAKDAARFPIIAMHFFGQSKIRGYHDEQ